MSTNTSILRPDIFICESEPVQVISYSSSDVDNATLDAFLSVASRSGAVGVAAIFTSIGLLKILALAAGDTVLMISLQNAIRSKRRKQNRAKEMTCPALRTKLLACSTLDKLAFDMDRISTALYTDHHLHVSPAIDAQSLYHGTEPRHSDAVLLSVLGGETTLQKANVLRILRNDDKTRNQREDVARRAWAAWAISTLPSYSDRRRTARTICTDKIPSHDLKVLSKCVRDSACLHALKPSKVKNDVNADIEFDKNGSIRIQLERYKTRIRSSHHQTLLIQTSVNGATIDSVMGHATRVRGKSATVKLNANVHGKLRSVHTIGKDFTNAETERAHIVLDALQGTRSLLSQPLSRQILCNKPAARNAGNTPSLPSPSIFYHSRPLNTSQTVAVQRILSEEAKDLITLVQGPPGTGKTTVIAACVKSLILNPEYRGKRHIWLLAQSNVAVKNIAVKLAEVEFFDFKLLVSNEFHFEWHEHLYEKIHENIIVSSTFADTGSMERRLLETRVILCTLSMLAHPLLMSTDITRKIPLETVLVDEASQIEIGDYIPMLSKFGHGIRKLAFIGDDKQLAPYGSEEVKDLRSIFEVTRLRKQAVFLSKQYRMPVPIGHFISRHVYGSRLSTKHKITAKACCRFIDVYAGAEVLKGGSFQNDKEVNAVIHVVHRFIREGKTFRIITPYDAQRALIERTLKHEKLPWEDKVFCVDSFQGNEDDHIILSVVRSVKVGFLSNLRRSNVMLSRCKASMTICTSRAYLTGIANGTLLGKMSAEWGAEAWIEWKDLLSGCW